MQKFNLDILGISEMRWNGYDKMTTATRETILYLGKTVGGDHHKQGVGLVSKRANISLTEWEPVSSSIITARFSFK